MELKIGVNVHTNKAHSEINRNKIFSFVSNNKTDIQNGKCKYCQQISNNKKKGVFTIHKEGSC